MTFFPYIRFPFESRVTAASIAIRRRKALRTFPIRDNPQNADEAGFVGAG
jgi:hypothetical protein